MHGVNNHAASLQFVLVLSTYRANPQWLQHPSNTAHTLCGSNLGLAQAEGYLWWPDQDNTALSYCVLACPSVGKLVNIQYYVQQQQASVRGAVWDCTV